MATVDNLRNSLIEKILTIRNKKFLEALDSLVSSTTESNDIIDLTDEQILMLQMSEEDIQNGRVISEDEFKNKTTSWLRGKVD